MSDASHEGHGVRDGRGVIAAFVPDLMDRSRFGGGATPVVFVRSIDDVTAAEPSLIVVDLDRCSSPGDFVIDGVRSIAFGSHVDHDGLAAAEVLGFGEVLARSAFFRRLPAILGSSSPSTEHNE